MQQLRWSGWIFGGALALLAASCGPDLGECDMTMLGGDATLENAHANAGQAVIDTKCANGRCHSADATGDLRFGAPAELNFDVVPLVNCGEPGNLATAECIKVLDGGEVVHDHLETMWAEIDEGAMPPPMPAGYGELSSAEKETVRNWLACGAPVIAAPAEMGMVGPDWTSIYNALQPMCMTCHGQSTSASGDGFVLGDAGDACGAYARVFGVAAMTDAGTPPCAGTGQLVVASSPDTSIMLQKLEGTQTCGAPMPLGTPLGPSNTIVMNLRAWIAAGAMKPAECP